jgi:hypothetical protein
MHYLRQKEINANNIMSDIISDKKSQKCPSLLGLRQLSGLAQTTSATSAKPVLRQCASCAGYLYRRNWSGALGSSVGFQSWFGARPRTGRS